MRVALAIAALCLPTTSAIAQSADELQDARRLFREALTQEVAGDWAGALAKMEQVARVKLTPQVRYHIAREKEHLGRYTEALGDYRLAEFEAQKSAAPDLDEISRARTDLEARVPKLTVVLPADDADATVALDGVQLGATQLAEDIPVNPGPHKLVAKRSQGGSWKKSFKAKEGESTRIEIPSAKPGAPDGEAAGEPVPGTPGDHPPEDTGKGAGPLPWVLAGVGAVGFIGAGVFYTMHNSAESDLESTCRGTICPESAHDIQDRSNRDMTLSGISLAVGVVGVGSAAVIWLTQGSSGPEKDTSSARLSIDAEVTPAWRGVSVHGAF